MRTGNRLVLFHSVELVMTKENLRTMKSRKEIVEILERLGVSRKTIDHSIETADVALKIANEMAGDGIQVDRKIVEAGALLHDCELDKPPKGAPTMIFEKVNREVHVDPSHATRGGKRVRELGFPEPVARCVDRHEGLYTRDEAMLLHIMPSPSGDLLPETPEEKAVNYSDNMLFVVGSGYDPWKDSDAIARGLFEYIDKTFKALTGTGLTMEHPILQRQIQKNLELRKYAKPEFFKKP